MEKPEDLRGPQLYEALMKLKPDELKPTAWALAVGLNRGFFTNMKSKGSSAAAANIRKLLIHIGKTEADLYGDAPDAVATSATPPANAIPFKMEGASDRRMTRDLPIWGTALGAPKVVDGEAIEQTTLNTGEVSYYAKRPVLLDGDASAYGLTVQGSSMYPVHSEGALLLASTKRTPRVGDDVVVYLRPNDDDDDGQRARCVLIKRLVRRTAQYVELEQFFPELTFRINTADVLRIDRVFTLQDLID